MNDRYHYYIKDAETGRKLQDLGYVLTDNPRRAAEMFISEETAWENKNYLVDTYWINEADEKKQIRK